MLTGMLRTLPAARNPDVAVAIPVVIAVDPHKSALRRWRTALDDRGRRANANHNLRKRRRR
jgi:hypothetical protein